MRGRSSQSKQVCVSFLLGFSCGFTHFTQTQPLVDGSASRGLAPCTQGPGAAPPLSPHRVCPAVAVRLHVAPQETCLHAPGAGGLACSPHISAFPGEACLRRSGEDGTAVSSLLAANQSPSRSTLRAQLHNSPCSLEGTAPYVQFPSYI